MTAIAERLLLAQHEGSAVENEVDDERQVEDDRQIGAEGMAPYCVSIECQRWPIQPVATQQRDRQVLARQHQRPLVGGSEPGLDALDETNGRSAISTYDAHPGLDDRGLGVFVSGSSHSCDIVG